MNQTNFTYKAKDGTEIAAVKWIPETEIRAVVQIVHGMAEHSARYKDFAEFLTINGIAVYAEDHRGHGLTAGSEDKTGYLSEEDGWNKVLTDVHQLTEIVKKEQRGKSLYLIGHSMGSFITRNYIAKWSQDLSGAIIIGTNFQSKITVKMAALMASKEKKKIGDKTRSPFLNNLSFSSYNKKCPEKRTEFDWLSRNQENVDRYVKDPYCGFVCTSGFYCDLMQGLATIRQKAAFEAVPGNFPILILSGDMDPVGDYGKGPAMVYHHFKKTGHNDVSIYLYPGDRHEVLNEEDCQKTYQDILKWLEKRF